MNKALLNTCLIARQRGLYHSTYERGHPSRTQIMARKKILTPTRHEPCQIIQIALQSWTYFVECANMIKKDMLTSASNPTDCHSNYIKDKTKNYTCKWSVKRGLAIDAEQSSVQIYKRKIKKFYKKSIKFLIGIIFLKYTTRKQCTSQQHRYHLPKTI